MYTKVLLIPILLIGTCVGMPTTTQHTTPSTASPERLTPVQQTSNGSSYLKCGAGKECVREYLCSKGSVSEDIGILVDLRTDDEESCPFLETCCRIDDKVKKRTIRSEDKPYTCGYRNTEGVGFKIEGNNNTAEFGEFPWMVAILSDGEANDGSPNVYQCGGSLITPQVVITAAHCVQRKPATGLKVRAGEWDLQSENEIFPHQDRQVADMIVHDSYSDKKRPLQNDIALLFLNETFELAPHVSTICLPPATLNFDLSRCYVSGWGKDKRSVQLQNVLKKIDLPVVPNAQCQTNLRNTRLGELFKLNDSVICAGGEDGKSTCNGDGGSPLVCPMGDNKDRFFQAGVVNWGVGCGEENIPEVYASVPYYRAWIDDQLAQKGIKTTYFTA